MLKTDIIFLFGALAQLGARHTGSVEATGSSPVCSIRVRKRPLYGRFFIGQNLPKILQENYSDILAFDNISFGNQNLLTLIIHDV